MGNLWLKIRVWTKITVFFLLLLYVLFFVYENNAKKVAFWYFPSREAQTSVLMLAFYAFAGGVIGFLLVRTTFNTVRQFRGLREKTLSERREREMADMRAKEAMLRRKPETTEHDSEV